MFQDAHRLDDRTLWMSLAPFCGAKTVKANCPENRPKLICSSSFGYPDGEAVEYDQGSSFVQTVLTPNFPERNEPREQSANGPVNNPPN